MASGDRLLVTVVGGGIAGLCAAIALRRAGHTVHVYERSGLNNEVGAAIHLPPNATRALLAWGLDPVRAKLVTVKSSFRAKADTLERFHVGTSEAAIAETYGGPWFFAHRVDFHDELKLLATDSTGEGIPVVVHVKSEVAKYDPDVPSITLSNGTVITSDVVIGADGIHSTAVEAVLGRVNKPVPSRDLYNFCYRFLIPTSEIESDPETSFWTEDDDGRMKFFVGDLKRIASYPCRNNEMHNFVALFHQDDFSMMKKEDWQAPVSKSQLLETFTGLHPKLEAVLGKATEIKQWALLYREPIPTWIRGKLVLAVRLALYEKIRRNRASLIQIFSNAGQDEAELIRQEASKYMPPEEVPKSPEEFFDFNFGYDVVQDTLSHLQSLDPSFEVPKTFFERVPIAGVYPKSARNAGSTMSYQDVSKTARAMPQIQMVEVNDGEP
ncbi:hypothetical protein KJ359_008338 [Pestalotiopsis sp. 9143b]|nr:hypothetical protein KJ359_008338 [Pestalotiopsis sp. 9143b]